MQIELDAIELEPLELLGGRVSLRLERGSSERTVHGVVLRTELVGTRDGSLQIALEAGPSIASCGIGASSRTFQMITAAELAAAVIGPTAITAGDRIEARLALDHPQRDYVVQWRESDLAFALRVLADDGIGCTYEHDAEATTLVLFDAADRLRGVGYDDDGATGPTLVRFVGDRGALPDRESVAVLGPARRAAPSRIDVLAWDWKQIPPTLLVGSDGADAPAAPLREDACRRRPIEIDRHQHLDETAARAARLGVRARLDAASCTGWGDVLAFTAGRTFELDGHPLPQHDVEYLLTRVAHRGSFVRPEERADGGARSEYSNEFVCHPLALGHAPACVERPRIDGTHSAIVVGPKGEEIHTDEYGRIKVRFAWDRAAPDDDTAGCWLRCVQPWAGAGLGTVFLPRIGMEVVVAFLDGDPDRPICTGCVYNGWNPPPYALPEHKTRTVLRTASTPGGEGFNEIFFEDAKGGESVSLHAQRNLVERVRADHTTHVGVDQSLTVDRDQRLELGGNQTEAIGGDLDRRIEGACSDRIGADRFTQVDGADELHAVQSQYVYVGCESGMARLRVNGVRRVEAAAAIELRCGPLAAGAAPSSEMTLVPTMARVAVGTSSIVLLPDRIVIAADTIVLQSKGAAIELDEHAHLRGNTDVVLARGADFDAGNRLQLDGDVGLHGAYTTVSGDDRVALVAVQGAGIVSVDATETAVHHDLKTRVEDSSGGFIEIAAGLLRANT